MLTLSMKSARYIFGIPTILAVHTSSAGILEVSGVIDGDLASGSPRAILLIAQGDISDLSLYGVGSANNGGGTDGQELALFGSVSQGDLILITDGLESTNFFTSNYSDQFAIFSGSVANINGNDAIEVFQSGSVIDLYGNTNTDGIGESWDYTDGYAKRIRGGSNGTFIQQSYNSVAFGLDGLSDTEHVSTIATTFGFTIIPAPTSLSMIAVGGIALARRRR